MNKNTVLFPLVALALGVTVSAFADEAPADTGKYEAFKAERLKELDERIQKLQEHRTCVSSAANKDAFKSCHGSMKAWRDSEKAEHMEKRNARMGERMKKLDERKAKLEEQRAKLQEKTTQTTSNQ